MELTLPLISSAFQFKIQTFTLPTTMKDHELVLIKLYLKMKKLFDVYLLIEPVPAVLVCSRVGIHHLMHI